VTDDVVPLSADPEAAIRLGREAVMGRPWIESRGPELADRLESGVRSKSRLGALFRPGNRTVGIATWEPHGPLGSTLDLWFLEPSSASVEAYRRFWLGIRQLAGPIAFAPGDIPGLSGAEEERLMLGLGFARYGRSEMRWPEGVSLPPVQLPPGGSLRPVGPNDSSEVVRLHRVAYHRRFDRYLFIEEEDEERDAARTVRDLFEGRWGEFAAEGSWAIAIDGRLVGAVLSVGRPPGVLIADVMVDPALQGRGIGKAVMIATLGALATAGRSPVHLNVTEGNSRAIRLYEGLGFLRSLGPSSDWYDPSLIPVSP
jgi:ribosomal protein S18 acetylase RimI-like enzyme